MSLGIVQFADFPAVIRPGGVEIPQARKPKFVGTVVGLERLFKEQLGDTIRIHRLPESVLFDGNLGGFAINSAGGRENDLFDAGVQGSIQQRETAFHIVVKILSGIRDGLADIGASGKMHDGVGTRQHFGKGTGIEHITLHEFETGGERIIACAEIVEDDDIVAGAPESPGGMTADVSGTTDYENGHGTSFPKLCAEESATNR